MAHRIIGVEKVGDTPPTIEVAHRQRHALPLWFEALAGKAHADRVADARHVLEAEGADLILRACKRIPIQVANPVRIAHVAHEQGGQLWSEPVASAPRVIDGEPVVSVLGEALRRISEGAALIRSKGEAGTGNIVEAVRHLRSIIGDIRKITQADSAELFEWAKRLQAPLPLVQEIAETGWLQVPLFCAGGIATPSDAALAMQLGAEAVFVGSGIFKSDDPAPRARAIVEATTHFRDAEIIAKVSRNLGAPMTGIGMDNIEQRFAERGW